LRLLCFLWFLPLFVPVGKPGHMKSLPLILRNCLRNRRRTFLTVVSIGTSLFLICTLKTLLEKLEDPPLAPDAAKRMVIRHAANLKMSLPIAYRERIAQMKGIDAISAAQWFGGVYKDPANFFGQYAVDADRLFDIYPEFHAEDADQKNAFIAGQTTALAGASLRRRFGWKIGDRVTLQGTILPVNVETTIAGFIDGGGSDANFYFHWEYLDQLFPQGTTQAFFIKASNADLLPAISEAVDTMFANSTAPTKTETESAFVIEVFSMWGNVRLLVLSISTVILFTVILVALNTVSMSVRDRTREIAVLRMLGFLPFQIVSMIVAESCLISATGGLLGALAAHFIYNNIDVNALSSGLIESFPVRWNTVLLSTVISLMIAIVSTVPPAWLALRLPIASAIRQLGD
jgi:putative ABC transport system permease protein